MPNLAARDAPRRQRRLSLRVTDQERALIERAALLTSAGDVTRFVMRASVDAARGTIEEHEVTRISGEMRQALYDLLLNPPPPGAALRKLAAAPVPDDVELIEN
ncbi:MAG: DUF1778 domain-containing protein [Candidatus Eremiobacteraeota bacterium]|nr:DUF1778 domain-containing protein [Candidatus Eremiobacteraeota bacterium]MBC5801711.1 DUF1778 domain-containing protein [Candidatus Eremiobacteraeota bacterium]MBC5822131.1 DUF1778 domain-containing protein [Candidatus Eremiobacteraeota bacterium]